MPATGRRAILRLRARSSPRSGAGPASRSCVAEAADRTARGQPLDGLGDRPAGPGARDLVGGAARAAGSRRGRPATRSSAMTSRSVASSATASRRWPQLAHVSWFAAWGDGACGNVGLGADGPGKAALMVGTSGALRAVVADPAPHVPAGLFAFRLGAGDRDRGPAERRRWAPGVGEPAARPLARLAGAGRRRDRPGCPRPHRAAVHLR